MAGLYALTAADNGASVAWISPTYKNSRPLWRFCEQMTAPVAPQLQINKSEREIAFPSGGRIGVYSADNPDSIRGDAFHLAIVDEAARVSEETWTDAIQPTLADYDGRAVLISTPKGKNWFFVAYSRAQADGQNEAAWHAPSAANPMPTIRRAAELARERMPERTYRQEWLAEFVEDGALFRNVRECATGQIESPEAHTGHNIIFGLDWAQVTDFNVLTALCSDCRRVVDRDRFNQTSWAIARGRVRAMYDKWTPAQIVAESNSIGSPNIEALQLEGLPVVSFETTATSKPPLIQSYVLAFERREITTLNDETTILEHEAFEEKRSAVTGRPTYSAPEGMHDDTVISGALAWWGMMNGTRVLFEA